MVSADTHPGLHIIKVNLIRSHTITTTNRTGSDFPPTSSDALPVHVQGHPILLNIYNNEGTFHGLPNTPNADDTCDLCGTFSVIGHVFVM